MGTVTLLAFRLVLFVYLGMAFIASALLLCMFLWIDSRLESCREAE